jgi:hypothetical protein
MKAWVMTKPIQIFKAPLSGCYYVTRAYKILDADKGHFQVTGQKEDVTDQIEALLAEREAQAVQREREAARGLVEVLEDASTLIQHMDETEFDGTKERIKSALATYNDNRKG